MKRLVVLVVLSNSLLFCTNQRTRKSWKAQGIYAAKLKAVREQRKELQKKHDEWFEMLTLHYGTISGYRGF